MTTDYDYTSTAKKVAAFKLDQFRSEAALENCLCREVKKHGGWPVKFNSMGTNGLPDQIIFYKGLTWLVELKTPKGTIQPIQKVIHKKFNGHGFTVRIIRTKEQMQWNSFQDMENHESVKYKPHAYQDHATEHIIENPFSGLFLDMGLGKTVATLTGVDRLMFDMMEVSKPLVIAPLRVARETWTTEASKWDHLRHFRIAKVIGDEKQRKTALLEKADIWIINRENIPWLIAHYGSGFPFDMLIIDELSSFKDPSSKRFKALRKIRPLVKRVVGLTGTPAPNSLLDLWPQLYLLDQGERLGKFITGYREKYFKATHQNGHVVYKYELHQPNKADAEILGKDIYVKEIYDKISDICISMKAEDYLRLPERIDNDILITLPAKVQKKYDEFERDQVLQLADQRRKYQL
jgi:SNF2 family DNA or RNA helicase